MTDEHIKDREEILDHIRSIFKGFLGKDKEAIKKAHSDDWTGFMGPSTEIERGIDAYMKHVEFSLANFNGVGYEIIDTEFQFYGDICLVYYIGRYDYKSDDGETHSIPLRSLDIYRRDSDGWIQAGSHITVIPESKSWGEDE